MTQPHEAKPRLRDNPEEQYRLLTENVKDFAIFLLDKEGKIATWNTGAERITGYNESEWYSSSNPGPPPAQILVENGPTLSDLL